MEAATDLDRLRAELMADEGAVKAGSRHVVYKDHLLNPTIGYGRLLSRGLSQDEAEYLLANDIKDVLAGLDRRIPWWRGMPEPAMRGLANLAFQLGLEGTLAFKTMLGHMERGDMEKAATTALNSLWARQTPARAKRVAAMIRGNIRAGA